MPITRNGSNIVVDSSVSGSVFPTTESDLAFPVLIDGSREPIVIGGSLYARSLEILGDVTIKGPVVARGDVRLDPNGRLIKLLAGLTVNGSVRCIESRENNSKLQDGISNAGVLIKGDLAVNQNIFLDNSVIFGSLRGVNCNLENSLILGTAAVQERLRIAMSTLIGYKSRDVSFEGNCLMLHAIGDSATKPLFLPFQDCSNNIFECDIRYYPAMRLVRALMNCNKTSDAPYPDYSRLYPETDWMRASVESAIQSNSANGEISERWILSIGGRISDISSIADSILKMSAMLKFGFEYEHYHPSKRPGMLENALSGLTTDERWILSEVCQ
jgi:cytoskeletal protein CcmA (bactofilin family)